MVLILENGENHRFEACDNWTGTNMTHYYLKYICTYLGTWITLRDMEGLSSLQGSGSHPFHIAGRQPSMTGPIYFSVGWYFMMVLLPSLRGAQ